MAFESIIPAWLVEPVSETGRPKAGRDQRVGNQRLGARGWHPEPVRSCGSDQPTATSLYHAGPRPGLRHRRGKAVLAESEPRSGGKKSSGWKSACLRDLESPDPPARGRPAVELPRARAQAGPVRADPKKSAKPGWPNLETVAGMTRDRARQIPIRG